MNDNHTNRRARPPRFVTFIPGIEQKPEPCFCGSENAFVDRDPDSGDLFVSCSDCGAEGPRCVLYDFAVASWNSLPRVSFRP